MDVKLILNMVFGQKILLKQVVQMMIK